MKDTPAFPVLIVDRPEELAHFNGMTLRDYFAAKALANKYTQNETMPDKVAEWAYAVADAMLKAREQ
jgi:hypothetical protein